MRLNRLFQLLILLFGTYAFASPPRIAVHPLVLIEAEKGRDELLNAFTVEVARQNIELVGTSEVRVFLAAQKGASCLNRLDCLVALSNTTKAYALMTTYAPDAPKPTLTASVVKPDGTIARSIDVLELRRDKKMSRIEFAQKAFRQVLQKLKLGDLPELKAADFSSAPKPVAHNDTPSIEDPPKKPVDNKVSVVDPVVTPAKKVEMVPVNREPLKVASYIVGAVGISSAILATGLLVSAAVEEDSAKKRLCAGSGTSATCALRLDTSASYLATKSVVESRRAAGAGFLTLGVIGVASGLAMQIVARTGPKEVPRVTMAATQNSAALMIAGEWP